MYAETMNDKVVETENEIRELRELVRKTADHIHELEVALETNRDLFEQRKDKLRALTEIADVLKASRDMGASERDILIETHRIKHPVDVAVKANEALQEITDALKVRRDVRASVNATETIEGV